MKILSILLFSFALTAEFCQDIFDSIPGKLKEIVPFPNQGGSFVNQIYLVTTDEEEELVLKIENPNWEKVKTLNEVLNLQFIQSQTSIPAPKILAYAETKELAGHEFILMTRMKGTPLNLQFEEIYADRNLYYEILSQLADILAELRSHAFTKIGNFKNDSNFKSPIDFSRFEEEPCPTFSAYARLWLADSIHEMKRLKNKGHRNGAYFEKHISQLEKLLESNYLSSLDLKGEIFPFSHQDFVMKNILVEGRTVTAVLDWEWSGFAPKEFEAKCGCDFLITEEDLILFDHLLKQKGVTDFFNPPPSNRQKFYQIMSEVYTLISCYEWIEGKLEHSAKFLDQKKMQRKIRATQNFDMQSFITNISDTLNQHINEINL
jgi:aminoglycoside phosphotransferase (APT) family kinase protein